MTTESNPGSLVIISGPSCVGKTTIIDKFLDLNPSFTKMISDTTRPPRNGEKNGIDYNFHSLKEFENKKKSNYYAEVEEYRPGDFKATARFYFDNLLNGQSYIIAITPNYAADFCSYLNLDQSTLDKIKPRIIPVYIGVSNLATIWHRAIKRDSSINRKDFISTLEKDYENWKKYRQSFPNFILNNDSVNESVNQLCEIVFREKTKKPSN